MSMSSGYSYDPLPPGYPVRQSAILMDCLERQLEKTRIALEERNAWESIAGRQREQIAKLDVEVARLERFCDGQCETIEGQVRDLKEKDQLILSQTLSLEERDHQIRTLKANLEDVSKENKRLTGLVKPVGPVRNSRTIHPGGWRTAEGRIADTVVLLGPARKPRRITVGYGLWNLLYDHYDGMMYWGINTWQVNTKGQGIAIRWSGEPEDYWVEVE